MSLLSLLGGKKFSGNAQLRKKGHILQHGTILLEIDPERMYSVLKAPYNVSKSRMVHSVYAKCMGVKEQLQNYDEKKLVMCIKQGFEKTLRIQLLEGKFSDYELGLAKQLVMKKYSNKRWLNKHE